MSLPDNPRSVWLIFSKYLDVTCDDRTGAGLVCLADFEQRASTEDVVGVQPSEQIAGGTREPFSECIRLASVFFTNPIIKLDAVAIYDIKRTILRSAIDHHVLQAWISLAQHATDRLFQKFALVVRRCNYCYEWKHSRWNEITIRTVA